MEKKCPQCHSDTAIEGKIYNQIDYVNPPAYFRPNNLPLLVILKSNIPIQQNSFLACSSCGALWSKLDNQHLQQIMAAKGKIYDL